jgi:proteasome lid subunit RPN8/RPN11
MGMPIKVTSAILARLRDEAERALPDECCGLLLGDRDRIVEVRRTANVAANPRARFEIDSQALIDAERATRRGGLQVLGYFHSHPDGPAVPSATDRAQAAHDGRLWVIVGNGGVAFWRDDEAGFAPLSYVVEDR